MITMVRVFPSEQPARDAAARLEAEGFTDVLLFTPEAAAGQEEWVVHGAVREGRLPGSHTGACIRSLREGRTVVAVPTLFGSGQLAIDILESCGAVDTELLPPHVTRNASPFSDLFGIPVLARFSPMTDLSIIPYTFGRPRSLRNPSPLSSLFGLRTLVSPRRPRTSSFGLPLLMRNPAPFSSLFGLPTLTRSDSGRRSSFGIPLLSRNPAPLSSLFGLRVLSKRTKRDRD